MNTPIIKSFVSIQLLLVACPIVATDREMKSQGFHHATGGVLCSPHYHHSYLLPF